MTFSKYQKGKWTSIFLVQLIVFFFIPFILPWILKGGDFFDDPYKPLNKDAYVYVYNGFRSLGGFLYVFMIVPLSVWFFGKRYCSWFCACGNLAETIGVTPWGANWVKHKTPRSKLSIKLVVIQTIFLIMAICYGLLIFLDTWKIIVAPDLVIMTTQIQNLVMDLMFGALIGVGAYPILGTRIWCRYGCPLAQLMKQFGRFSKSKFYVVANEKCKGIGHCSLTCPMGIDVASYAHKNRVAIKGKFGLDKTPCIGCGGCIDSCPLDALSFGPILNKKNIGAK